MANSEPDLPAGLDLGLLAECRWMEICRRTFEEHNKPVELWEAFVLVVREGDRTRQELKRLETFRKTGTQNLVDDLSRELFEALDSVREHYGDLGRKLKTTLGNLKLPELEGEGLDLAIGLLISSDDGRRRAEDWVRTPHEFRSHSEDELQNVLEYVEGYGRTMDMVRTLSGPRTTPLPEGVDAELVEDLQMSLEAVEVLVKSGHQAELWEIFRMVSLDREGVRELVRELQKKRAGTDTAGVAAGALAVFEALIKERGTYSQLVHDLRNFLHDVLEEDPEPAAEEIAIAFTIVSDRGRDMANDWVHDPEKYRPVALEKVTALFEKAEIYRKVLEDAG